MAHPVDIDRIWREQFGITDGDDAVIESTYVDRWIRRDNITEEEIRDSLSSLVLLKNQLAADISQALTATENTIPVVGKLQFSGVNKVIVKGLKDFSIKTCGNICGSYERIAGIILGVKTFPEKDDLVWKNIPIEIKYAQRNVYGVNVPEKGVMIAFYNENLKAGDGSVKYAIFGNEKQLTHYFSYVDDPNRRGHWKMNRHNGQLVFH